MHMQNQEYLDVGHMKNQEYLDVLDKIGHAGWVKERNDMTVLENSAEAMTSI